MFGCNGIGKTNVLEAVSLFAPGRGLRRAKLEDLSRRPDQLGWKLIGQIDIDDRIYEVSTLYGTDKSRKIFIDGKSVSQHELGRLIKILWITPLMDRIWLEGSNERRRFLDRLVSTIVSDHTDNLVKYYKALRQRNKLLKDKSSDYNWFKVLEHQMAHFGASIEVSRTNVLSQIMRQQEESNSVFPTAKLSLACSDFLDPRNLESQFEANREKELWVGRTLFGPHLNDLHAIYSSKCVEAKNCSTGEQKALLISIVLATARIQIEVFNTAPIILFDEVSAHLDGKSRVLLYDELCKLGSQVFLTGTDEMIFSELKNRAQFFELFMEKDQTICDQS